MKLRSTRSCSRSKPPASRPERTSGLGLDTASSEFYHDGKYELASEKRSFDSLGFVDYLAKLADSYPIVSIEDGMAEDDWEGWKLLTDRLGSSVQLVGDDLFVTNTEILKEGHRKEGGELDSDQAESNRYAD